ncbi:Pol polyprotein, partial [Thalictrum thalictroides]
MDDHQRNYTVTEKECLAVILAVKEFRPFIYGRKFVVVTDHSLLRWLTTLKDPEGWLARWALKLQAFDYEIRHWAGAMHQNADGLSRLPMVAFNEPELDRLYDLIATPSLWLRESESDQALLKRMAKDTITKNGMLYKQFGNKAFPYVRPSGRLDIAMGAHRATGHGSPKVTYYWLRERYYWDYMLESLVDLIDSCQRCKVQWTWKEKFNLNPVAPKFAFHTVSIDTIGPLPVSRKGNRWIIVAIDNFTRWVEAKAVPANTDKNTAKFLTNQVIYRHGCPQNLLHDNGANYISKLLGYVKEAMGIHGVVTAPYHPQTNGTVERVNGTLVKIIRSIASETSDWDEYVPAAVMAYRLATHSAMGYSPFRLLYGREPALPAHLLPSTLALEKYNYDVFVRDLTREIVAMQASGWEKMRRGQLVTLGGRAEDTKAYPIYQLDDK